MCLSTVFFGATGKAGRLQKFAVFESQQQSFVRNRHNFDFIPFHLLMPYLESYIYSVISPIVHEAIRAYASSPYMLTLMIASACVEHATSVMNRIIVLRSCFHSEPVLNS